ESVVYQVAEPGRLEQRGGVACVADELAVRVGVGDEVAGGRDQGQFRGPVLGHQDDDGVVQDRRPAVELLVGGQPGTVAGINAADGRRDELHVDVLLPGRGPQILQGGRVN